MKIEFILLIIKIGQFTPEMSKKMNSEIPKILNSEIFAKFEEYSICQVIHDKYLYSGHSDGTIRKWDLKTNLRNSQIDSQVAVLRGHKYWVNCLVIHDNNL